MKRIGENFNNVSEKLKKELIKPLGKDGVANYRLLNGQLDIGSGMEVFGASRSIRSQETIWDPYHKEKKGEDGRVEYEGAWVDIGVPDVVKNNVVERCKKYLVDSASVGIAGNGRFTLRGDNADDVAFHEVFSLSLRNGINPYRAEGSTPEFEYIDPLAKAKKDDATSDLYEDALMLVKSMKNVEIEQFWLSFGLDPQEKFEVKRSWVRKYAREEPKDFLERQSGDSDIRKKSEIQNALNIEAIKYDAAAHKIVDGNTGRVIAILERVEGLSHVDSFADWLKSVKTGNDVWKGIQKQVAAKIRARNGVKNTESATS